MNIPIPDNPNPAQNYMLEVAFADPLNCDALLSNVFYCLITGDTTLNITNSRVGGAYIIQLEMDGVGGHTVTLGALFSGEIVGSNTINTDAGAISLISGTVAEDGSLMYNTDVLAKTFYWSCSGSGFDGFNPDIDDISKDSIGTLTLSADGISVIKSVSLPDGATITSVKVYGNVATNDSDWLLRRLQLSDTTNVNVALEKINSEDTSISYGVIDNSLYSYNLVCWNLLTDDVIYGARISYTV